MIRSFVVYHLRPSPPPVFIDPSPQDSYNHQIVLTAEPGKIPHSEELAELVIAFVDSTLGEVPHMAVMGLEFYQGLAGEMSVQKNESYLSKRFSILGYSLELVVVQGLEEVSVVGTPDKEFLRKHGRE